MELKIINGSTQLIAEYLPKLKLKGRENRARQKLLKKASEKVREFYSDIQEIKSEYQEDEIKQNAEFEKLLKEEVILDMTEYANLMLPLYDALLDYPHEIDANTEPGKPSDATIHDYLVDVLENGFDEGGNNEPKIEDAQFKVVEDGE